MSRFCCCCTFCLHENGVRGESANLTIVYISVFTGNAVFGENADADSTFQSREHAFICAWCWRRLHENPECLWNRKWKTFLLLATTLMRKHGLGLPWLITPGKIWPPAVNTDPTIDASLALPYNHLRTKLCSALPIMEFLTPSFCHYTSRAPPLVPAFSACFRRAEWCQLRQNILILNLRFQRLCMLTAGDNEIIPVESVLLMDVTLNYCWKQKCLPEP